MSRAEEDKRTKRERERGRGWYADRPVCLLFLFQFFPPRIFHSLFFFFFSFRVKNFDLSCLSRLPCGAAFTFIFQRIIKASDQKQQQSIENKMTDTHVNRLIAHKQRPLAEYGLGYFQIKSKKKNTQKKKSRFCRSLDYVKQLFQQ